MTKFRQYYQNMIDENKNLFEDFRLIHDKYVLSPQENQQEFNETGKQIQKIIKQYEDKLCGRQEGNGYSSYSANLAEKFQSEIKKDFPKIDMIGVIINTPAPTPSFQIKKISL